MAEVRVFKFDVGSLVDVALSRVQSRMNASTRSEAFRRSVALADYITEAQEKGGKVTVTLPDGTVQELILG
jgi:hypothetical protein